MADTLPPPLGRPIIIVGSPRSGTSMLGNLLGCHSSLSYLTEPRLIWRYGNDSKSDMLRPVDATPRICEYIRKSFTEAVRAGGGQRLLEKLPSNSLRMGFVERVLPGCQFVHIMRDGVESVLSIRKFWQQHASGIKPKRLMQRMQEIHWRQIPYYGKEVVRRAMPRRLAGLVDQPVWGPRIPGIGCLTRDLSLLEVSCLQWRMCVEAACHYGRQLPVDRYMECRLEEMSPELLRSVLGFCGLDESPDVWVAYDNMYDPSRTAHHGDKADAKDLETIRQWIEPTMQWLGYYV